MKAMKRRGVRVPPKKLPIKRKGNPLQRRSHRPFLFPLLMPLLCSLFLAGLWWNGVPQHLGSQMMERGFQLCHRVGLSLQSAEVAPTEYTSIDEIVRVSGVFRGQSIFAVDPDGIRCAIEKMPWVWSAIVQRRFPDTLSIRVVERQPMAIWRVNQKTFLVDKEGHALTEDIPAMFKILPVIAGEEAAACAPELFYLLDQYPDVRAKVKMAVRIGKRRWNLVFESGTQVFLPATEYADALDRLSELEGKKILDSSAVQTIDLRVKDRLILKMTPEATIKLQTKGTTKET